MNQMNRSALPLEASCFAPPAQYGYRSRTTNCVLVFLIGAFVQLSIPLTDLYEIPNVRGGFFAFVVATFAFRFLSGQPIRAGTPFIMSYLVLAVIWAVGILYSRAPIYGASKAFLVASYFWVLGMVIYNLIDDLVTGKAFLYGLGLGSCILVGITITEVGNPIELLQTASRFFRLRFGEDGNPIMLARHLALAVTVAITILVARRMLIDWIWALPLGVLAFVYLVATGSKGPLLALFIACVGTSVLLVKGVTARFWRIVLVTILSIACGIVLTESLPKAFVQERVFDKIENLSLRLPAYKIAFDAIMDSDPLALLIGHGTGDFGYLELKKDGRAYPHNMLLEVVYENGLVGLGAILVAIVLPAVEGMRGGMKPMAREHRVILIGATVSYLAAVINAQFSGDLGANLLIGLFGATTVSLARVESIYSTES
jgi:O-antigen ligase